MRSKEGETVTEISSIAQNLSTVVHALREMADGKIFPGNRPHSFLYELEIMEEMLKKYTDIPPHEKLPYLRKIIEKFLEFAFEITGWYNPENEDDLRIRSNLFAVLEAVKDDQLEFMKLQTATMRRFAVTLANAHTIGARNSMLAALESTPAAPSAPVEAS